MKLNNKIEKVANRDRHVDFRVNDEVMNRSCILLNVRLRHTRASLMLVVTWSISAVP